MKAEIRTSKRGRKCQYCGLTIPAGEKFILITEFVPNVRYPIKKNNCFDCSGKRVVLIPVIKQLLNDLLKLQKELNKELI